MYGTKPTFAIVEIAASFAKCHSDTDDYDDVSGINFTCEIEESEEFYEVSADLPLKSAVKTLRTDSIGAVFESIYCSPK